MQRKMNDLLDKISQEEGETFLPDRDHIHAELVKHDKAYSNIIIKILSAIGGILATMAFLGFVLLAGIYDSESGMLVLGMLFILAAIGISRISDHVFLDTVVLTLYISGFILAGIGIGVVSNDGHSAIMLCMLLSLAGTLLSRGFMIVMISVVIFNGSLLAYFSERGILTSFFAFPLIISGAALLLVSVGESFMISKGAWLNKLYKPLQSGLFISFLGGLIWMSHSYMFGFFSGINNFRFISLSIDIMTIVMVSKIISSLGIRHRATMAGIYLFAAVVLAAVFYAPGISGAIFLLLLSVYYGYKAEIGISIAALGYFIVKFYYDLQTSLLVKSGMLFIPGMLLIVVWYYVHRQMKKNEKV